MLSNYNKKGQYDIPNEYIENRMSQKEIDKYIEKFYRKMTAEELAAEYGLTLVEK